jgi:hypothetical protein
VTEAISRIFTLVGIESSLLSLFDGGTEALVPGNEPSALRTFG